MLGQTRRVFPLVPGRVPPFRRLFGGTVLQNSCGSWTGEVKDRMMDRMMNNMSTAEKLEMMEKMMPLMMRSLSEDAAPGETPEPEEED